MTRVYGKQYPNDSTNELNYGNVFENLALGMTLIALSGHVIKVNSTFARMLGYPAETLIGKHIVELTHPDDVSVTESVLHNLSIRKETNHRFEKRYLHRDGHEIWAEVWVFLPQADSDVPKFLIASVLDITERKRAERALKESEAGYRALVRGIPDIVIRFDSDGRHLFVSENICDVTDRKDQEFIGKTHEELGFTREQCKFWHDSIIEVFERGVPIESEFGYEGKGRHFIFNWRLLPEFDQNGAVKSALSISRDVTRQRQIEADYKRLFREMLDGVALHEIICNSDNEPVNYRFLSVNPAFERITGLTADAILGQTVLDVIPTLEHQWIDVYGKVALTGEPAFFESSVAEMGKYFQVTAFSPTHGQFVCIFSDITNRKRAEEEKERLEAQLLQAQKFDSVGRLAGGIAHDFNNMVSVILGSVELAEVQAKPTEPIYADLMEIRLAAERSAELTRQLLAFARQQPVSPVIVNVSNAIEGILTMLRRLIGDTISLNWLPTDDLWTIRIDPSQLDQILVNLCVNARDAIGNSGRLTIEAENVLFEEIKRTRFGDIDPGQFVRISVSDNGSGIKPSVLDHIFEPFFTTKNVGEGTGLGLSTVYGIVNQSGGYIDVTSTLNGGTTFDIYWSRDEGEASNTKIVESSAPSVRSRANILLLEDDPIMLRVVQRILVANGYTVLGTRTPYEALRTADEHGDAIELLVTDVVMPEMNGRELSERLISRFPQMKVLFMSGYTANVIAHHGFQGRAYNFIEKPFKGSELLGKVRHVLGERCST